MTRVGKLLRHVGWMSVYSDRKTFLTYLGAIAREASSIARTGDLGPADRRMFEGSWRFKTGSGRWVRIDGKYFSYAREIYARRAYTSLEGYQIREGDVVVDLGANVGTFSLFAASCGARVVAVEAQSGFLPRLEELMRVNELLTRVEVEHGMVGGSAGVFADISRRSNASHWGSEPQELSMEDLIHRHELERIDFLKIDIEGSEFALIREPAPWLGIVQRIAMEHHPKFGDIAVIRAVLVDHGFEVTLIGTSFREVQEPAEGDRYGYLFATRRE